MKTKQKVTKRVPLKDKAKRQAKRYLVPHKSNHYRPHLIRAQGVIAVLILALLAQVVYGYITTGHFQVLGRVSHVTTADLLADTNTERQKAGIQPLALNDQLSQAAFSKAKDMLANDYWAHTSPTGVTPWQWLQQVDYNYSVAGENLAKNYPSASTTVAAWMGSEAHRANVLNASYQDVGFAVVDGELNGRETTLIVAYYASPATVAAVKGSTDSANHVEAAPALVGSVNPFAYFASAAQSLSPVSIAFLGLFALIAIIGVVAHHFRNRLPKAWKRSWRLHHGMYTFWGMIALGVMVILATGGGQI